MITRDYRVFARCSRARDLWSEDSEDLSLMPTEMRGDYFAYKHNCRLQIVMQSIEHNRKKAKK